MGKKRKLARDEPPLGQVTLGQPGRAIGGEIIGSLRLENVLRPKARKKVTEQLKRRLAEDRGVSPSEISDDEVSRAGLDVLSEIGVSGGQFTTGFRRRLRANELLLGQSLTEPTLLRETFGLETPEEGGGLVTDPVTLRGGEPEDIDLTTTSGTLTNLEQGALDIINQGSALVRGDFSGELGRDVLLGFNEQFTQPLATSGGFARSGGADFSRSVGARRAGIDVGSQLVAQGLGTLGVTDPLALPGAQIDLLQTMRSQSLFNTLTEIQRRNLSQATRLVQNAQQPGEQFKSAAVPAAFGFFSGVGGQATGAFLPRNQQQ